MYCNLQFKNKNTKQFIQFSSVRFHILIGGRFMIKYLRWVRSKIKIACVFKCVWCQNASEYEWVSRRAELLLYISVSFEWQILDVPLLIMNEWLRRNEGIEKKKSILWFLNEMDGNAAREWISTSVPSYFPYFIR